MKQNLKLSVHRMVICPKWLSDDRVPTSLLSQKWEKLEIIRYRYYIYFNLFVLSENDEVYNLFKCLT